MSTVLTVAIGGGVNSSAMLVEMSRRAIKPDLLLFADTGGERPETYEAVKKLSQWCMVRFGIGIITVKKTYKGQPESLESNCLRMKMLPSIAYGFNACSLKHKVDPQNKFVNNWAPAQQVWNNNQKITKAIGYDAGESRRAKIQSDDKYEYWYPLIEWGLDRDDCVEICKSEGLPTAKSSCFFCPSMKKFEIIELAKHHPDLAARAIDMEDNAANNLITVKGLGRNYAWKTLLESNDQNPGFFDFLGEPEIPCGCYDG